MSLNLKSTLVKVLLVSIVLNIENLHPMLSCEQEESAQSGDQFDILKFSNFLQQLSNDDFYLLANAFFQKPDICQQILSVIEKESIRRREQPKQLKSTKSRKTTPFPFPLTIEIPQTAPSKHLSVIPTTHKRPVISPKKMLVNPPPQRLTSQIIRETSFGSAEKSMQTLPPASELCQQETQSYPSTPGIMLEKPSFDAHNTSMSTVVPLEPAEGIFIEDFDAVSNDSPPTVLTNAAKIIAGIGVVSSFVAFALNSEGKDAKSRSKCKFGTKKNRLNKLLIFIGLISFASIIGCLCYNKPIKKICA